MVDLASSRFGGEVVWCSDDFFAEASNLVNPAPPVWKEGVFTDRGKWMDGWETRRRRGEGHDSCIVRLGLPGIVHSVTVDTSYFTGNFPESFSVDACGIDPERLDEAEWVEVLGRSPLSGDSVTTFDLSDSRRITHLRLNIFPDGGVARLRAEGTPVPARELVCPDEGLVDLALATVGGEGVDASDAHYASPANLVSPTEPEGMWDGWETARRRGSGHDWAMIRLGLRGRVEAVDVDTRHFKGNSPGWVSLDTALGDPEWSEACERVEVEPDMVNRVELPATVDADRVRLNIYPDGGVARLRVWGRPHPEAAAAVRMRYLDSLFPQQARAFFRTACEAGSWIAEMVEGRPYGSAPVLLEAASAAFDGLSRDDWLEAFAAHPRIGEREGRQSADGERHSGWEQAGIDPADVDELSEINRRYEERFGYTYIVRAAGRSGAELLELARKRLENDPGSELAVAEAQQREITLLRLRRMLCMTEEES